MILLKEMFNGFLWTINRATRLVSAGVTFYLMTVLFGPIGPADPVLLSDATIGDIMSALVVPVFAVVFMWHLLGFDE